MAKNSVTISRNIYESISFIFQASRVSGLCPLEVLKKANNVSLVWSRKVLVYSYVSVIFIVCSSVYGLMENYKIKEIHNIRLRNIAGIVCTLSENAWLLFSCLLGTILAPFCQGYFFKYLKCLNQIDILLGPRNLNQKKTCTRVMVTTLTITVIVLTLDITLWSKMVTKRTSLMVYLLHTLPFYLTYVWKMISELHFWLLVHLMQVRLVCLNDELSVLLREVEICEGFLKNNEYMDKKLVKVINFDDGTKNSRGKEKSIFSGEKISTKVKNIINIHNLLVEASTAINNYFGINVLVILFGCLVHLLVTPYVLHLQITETKNRIFVASQLMWLISHILRLIFIIEPCQAYKTQVTGTVTTYLVILFQFKQ